MTKSYIKKPSWGFSFGKDYEFRILPKIEKSYSLSEPMWKDKFETPRCERIPYLTIRWFGLYVYFDRGSDAYWERWLWIHKYHNGNEQEAIKNWGWVSYDGENKGKSTWFKEY